MPRIVPLFAAVALTAAAATASAHHVPEDARVAHHVPEDARVAKSEADPAAGEAAKKLVGTYQVLLGDEEKKQVEEARKKAAEAPEGDELAAAMLQMLEAMASIKITFTATEMTMNVGEEAETVKYTVVEQTADTLKLKTEGTKNAPQGSEAFTIKLTEKGIVMSKDGDQQALTFLRQN